MASKELRAWAEKHAIAECLPALVDAGFDTFDVLLQLDEKYEYICDFYLQRIALIKPFINFF